MIVMRFEYFAIISQQKWSLPSQHTQPSQPITWLIVTELYWRMAVAMTGCLS